MTALSQMVQLNPYQAAARLSVEKIWQRLPPADRPCACLIWAVLAPSPHNTQPWLWKVTTTDIELRADRSRLLQFNDPAGRKLVISCGCALQNLTVALRAFQIDHRVIEFPDPTDPDLLARVELSVKAASEDPHAVDLLTAIRHRRTNRAPFTELGAPPEVIDALGEDAREFGVRCAQVADPSRAAVAELVSTADREELDDANFRTELAAWIRPRRTRRQDGMPADLLGARGASAVLAGVAMRRLNLGHREASRDHALVDHSPDLLVIGSESDDARAWLSTGRALTRMTLRLAGAGLAHGYLGQACEVPRLRDQLATMVELPNPQLIVRAGKSMFRPRASPRRPIADVLISDLWTSPA